MLQRFNIIYEFYPKPEKGRFRAEIIGRRGLWNQAMILGATAVEKFANEKAWESQIRSVGEEPGEIIYVHDSGVEPHVVEVTPLLEQLEEDTA